MSTQHTPGPWKANRYGVIEDRSGSVIAGALRYGCASGELPMNANAELIAAAPEMLKFIQKVARWELVDCDEHEYVMKDEEVRDEAHRILNGYHERLKLTAQ